MQGLKAVIYNRVSSDDQADYGTGLETQKLESIQLAERLEAVVVGVESDPGISGTLYPRPGLERALQAIESGKANALIAHRVDRLGRKLWIPPQVYERVKAAGGRLFTCQDGEVTSENIIMFSLRCGLSETDYSNILNNMKKGKRRRAEGGSNPVRSFSPFGYHIIQNIESGVVQPKEVAGTYEIVEEEATVVCAIFERYAAGDSLRAICKYLNQEGIPTPQQKRKPEKRFCWQVNMISRIVTDTVYKGYAMWGKTAYSEDLQVRIPTPPIVSEELWELCQRIKKENREVSGVRTDRKHLWTGIAMCPACGRKMAAAKAHYQKRYKPGRELAILYRCKDHAPSRNPSGEVCRKDTYHEIAIKAAVRGFFQTIVQRPEFIAAAVQTYQAERRVGYSQEEHVKVIQDLRELDARETATVEAYSRAIQLGTRPEVFEKLLTDIAVERQTLTERKAAMEAVLAESRNENPKEIAVIAAQYAEDILELLDSETLTPDIKNGRFRRVLRAICPTETGFRILCEPMTPQSHSLIIADVPVPRPKQGATYTLPVTSVTTDVTPNIIIRFVDADRAEEFLRAA